MCPVEEFFETLKLKEWGIVFLGNNKARKVQDMVSIRLKMYDIWEMVLQDMKYVSKIEKFLSISMFDLMGLSTKIERGTIRTLKQTFVVPKTFTY